MSSNLADLFTPEQLRQMMPPEQLRAYLAEQGLAQPGYQAVNQPQMLPQQPPPPRIEVRAQIEAQCFFEAPVLAGRSRDEVYEMILTAVTGQGEGPWLPLVNLRVAAAAQITPQAPPPAPQTFTNPQTGQSFYVNGDGSLRPVYAESSRAPQQTWNVAPPRERSPLDAEVEARFASFAQELRAELGVALANLGDDLKAEVLSALDPAGAEPDRGGGHPGLAGGNGLVPEALSGEADSDAGSDAGQLLPAGTGSPVPRASQRPDSVPDAPRADAAAGRRRDSARGDEGRRAATADPVRAGRGAASTRVDEQP